MENKTKDVVPRWHGSRSDWFLVVGAALFAALIGWVIYQAWNAPKGADQNQSIIKCSEHCFGPNHSGFNPNHCVCNNR